MLVKPFAIRFFSAMLREFSEESILITLAVPALSAYTEKAPVYEKQLRTFLSFTNYI